MSKPKIITQDIVGYDQNYIYLICLIKNVKRLVKVDTKTLHKKEYSIKHMKPESYDNIKKVVMHDNILYVLTKRAYLLLVQDKKIIAKYIVEDIKKRGEDAGEFTIYNNHFYYACHGGILVFSLPDFKQTDLIATPYIKHNRFHIYNNELLTTCLSNNAVYNLSDMKNVTMITLQGYHFNNGIMLESKTKYIGKVYHKDIINNYFYLYNPNQYSSLIIYIHNIHNGKFVRRMIIDGCDFIMKIISIGYYYYIIKDDDIIKINIKKAYHKSELFMLP